MLGPPNECSCKAGRRTGRGKGGDEFVPKNLNSSGPQLFDFLWTVAVIAPRFVPIAETVILPSFLCTVIDGLAASTGSTAARRDPLLAVITVPVGEGVQR
ncbi:hypothetical protein B296_00020641 [Ensete ventricosum]|uniref:Uncharacterized protein n=1 Tax=Ensete ventricosum TaxID=4639 RepID=A0A427AX01_ENSVE|nr:hypothetical protein B296_00020641 [Ensete ventricosum]